MSIEKTAYGGGDWVKVSIEKNEQGQQVYRTSNGHTFSIDQLHMYVTMRLIGLAEAQFHSKEQEISRHVDEQKEADDMLETMLEGKPEDKDTAFIPGEVKVWMKKRGLNPPDKAIHKEEWSKEIESIRAELDEITSTNQTETTELRQMSDFHAELNEMLANWQSTHARTMEKLIDNIKS